MEFTHVLPVDLFYAICSMCILLVHITWSKMHGYDYNIRKNKNWVNSRRSFFQDGLFREHITRASDGSQTNNELE